MWASLPVPPLKPWLPNAISAAGPSSRRRSLSVHCHRNREEITDAAQLETKGNPLKATGEKKLELEEQRQFSGVDVLMALEKATARNLREKNGKRELHLPDSGIDNQGATSTRFRNIRSLSIKPEWNDRLVELERRLSQLLST